MGSTHPPPKLPDSWLSWWLFGLVHWRAPPAVRTELVLSWAGLGIGAVLLWPWVASRPTWQIAALAVAALGLLGAVNALFQRLGQ